MVSVEENEPGELSLNSGFGYLSLCAKALWKRMHQSLPTQAKLAQLTKVAENSDCISAER